MNAYKAAVAAHQQQDLDTALSRYLEVLSLNPGIAPVHNNVAAIRLSRGEKTDAEKHWRTAVQLKPEYAEAQYNLAVLLSEKSDAELAEAERHCRLAIEHKEQYTSAYHLMGNILMSAGRQPEAAEWYARASSAAAGASAASSASAGASSGAFRWDGVEVGHSRTLKLADGATLVMRTLSLRPLAFLLEGFLTAAECDRLIALSRTKLKASPMMGDASAIERTSESVFLGAAADPLLAELQRRRAAIAQLPLARLEASEDLQVVHYEQGATFGMHHDSSAFLPRYLTAFYYLNDVEDGGETAFPAADGAMAPSEAMALKEPAAEGGGLVVKPKRGAALVLWYNQPRRGGRDRRERRSRRLPRLGRREVGRESLGPRGGADCGAAAAGAAGGEGGRRRGVRRAGGGAACARCEASSRRSARSKTRLKRELDGRARELETPLLHKAPALSV